MAYTQFGVNDPETNKIFAQDLNRVILKRVEFMSLASPDPATGAIEMRDELQKAAGDLIYFFLEFQLAEDGGRYGFETLENHEKKLETDRDSVLIDQTRNAVKQKGKMSAQRVPWEFRKRARNALADWFQAYYDRAWGWILGGMDTTATFVAGAPVPTSVGQTLHNVRAAPTRKQWADPTATNDQSLTGAGDEFNLACIDRAVAKAQTAEIPIRPFRVDGQEVYVQIIHPYDLHALRANGTTWNDIQQQLIAGGYAKDNPLFRGTAGFWNGTLIKVSHRVCNGVNASTNAALPNVRRCPFLGAQAGIMAFGRGEGPTRYNWTEEKFDYKDTLGVGVSTVVGGKKTQFTPPGGSLTDFGVIVTSSYAPAPV